MQFGENHLAFMSLMVCLSQSHHRAGQNILRKTPSGDPPPITSLHPPPTPPPRLTAMAVKLGPVPDPTLPLCSLQWQVPLTVAVGNASAVGSESLLWVNNRTGTSILMTSDVLMMETN